MPTITFTGSPLELGAQVFTSQCLPVIEAALRQPGFDADAMAHLYAGFLQACMGSLAADFGHQQATELVNMMAEEFKRADLGSPSSPAAFSPIAH